MKKRQIVILIVAALCIITLAACKKKVAPPPPPPPPPPAPAAVVQKPVINFFNAEPSTVEKSQGAALRWSVNDATSVAIDQGIGDVSPNGRRTVYPADTITYTLTAKNSDGDTATATTTVTVTSPPPVAPVTETPHKSALERLQSEVKDIYFDYDKDDIRDDQQGTVQADATALKSIFADNPDFVVSIEGNCDERGSAEYNLALGDRRASKAKDALIALGVPADKLKSISYGKERPVCTDQTEDCYQRNRHDHFAAAQ